MEVEGGGAKRKSSAYKDQQPGKPLRSEHLLTQIQGVPGLTSHKRRADIGVGKGRGLGCSAVLEKLKVGVQVATWMNHQAVEVQSGQKEGSLQATRGSGALKGGIMALLRTPEQPQPMAALSLPLT